LHYVSRIRREKGLLKEIGLRLTLVAAMLAALASAPAIPFSQAQAQECTGENCPPPSGQGGAGHDCESKKKEQTIS
jgi:hypothetical protein